MSNKNINPMERWLEQFFDEVTPQDFYRAVFPAGELDKKGEMSKGKYTAIAVCISQTEKRWDKKKNREVPKVYRYTMTDDLDLIDDLIQRDDFFCLMAPISYAGKKRTAENARFAYGLAFDVDHIRIGSNGEPDGLINLWFGHIEAANRLPKPTYIVSSGTGLHLYYLFERAVPLFPNIAQQLQKLKHELTWMIWNEGIVDIKNEKEVQYEGIYQGMRMPGTITKNDGKTRVFETGERVSIEHLNAFVDPKYRVTDFQYKSHLSKAEAKERYPEWYEERIVKGNKGVIKPWAVNRGLYEWWKREILKKAEVGHRYYCLMILSIIAKKCSFYDPKKNPNPVTYEELESDAFAIADYFETLTVSDENHFTEIDILEALDAYENIKITYPRNLIEYKAGFALPKTKRNNRKQSVHLRGARAIQQINDEANGTDWRDGNGRKAKKDIVQEWRQNHPNGTKYQCIKDTGLSKPTVYKWWDGEDHITIDQDIVWDNDMRPVLRKENKRKIAEARDGFAAINAKLEAELAETRRKAAALQAQLDALKKQQEEKK